ncbi:MAG: hypothetical protein JWO93_477 [Micrococcaceae bacterium]|nr:hypothetical protein [Micrococcaceae bacterium]
MVFGLGKKSRKASAAGNADGGMAEAASGAETPIDDATVADGSAVTVADGSAVAGTGSAVTGPDTPAEAAEPNAPEYERATLGPFDISEVEGRDGYVDLGALLITPHENLQLRLEMDEASQRVIAVTLELGSANLQLQAFAAPRSENLWPDIRGQIAASVSSQGGIVEVLEGSFGPEVLAKLPAQGPDGLAGFRVARFIGVDGPRWFLRGVFGGNAALDRDAAAELEQLFRGVVVVRGENPLPPRDLLALTLPRDAKADETGHVAADHPVAAQGGQPFRRGPEITQVG